MRVAYILGFTVYVTCNHFPHLSTTLRYLRVSCAETANQQCVALHGNSTPILLGIQPTVIDGQDSAFFPTEDELTSCMVKKLVDCLAG